MAKTTSPPAKSLGSPRILATSSIEPYSPLRSEKSDDTDLDNDGADVSISTAKTSPNTSTASGSQKHAVAEVIAESFPPYDHQSSLVTPFERELELGVQFRERESGVRRSRTGFPFAPSNMNEAVSLLFHWLIDRHQISLQDFFLSF